MAVRHIVTVDEDNPVLRRKARRVRAIGPQVQALIDDMVQTMREAPGVGLAAPQLGVLLRVIVVEVPEDEDEPGSGRLYTLINPEIVKTSPEFEEGQEGCLSIPGYVGLIKRHPAVTVRALNRGGKAIRIKAQGFLARVLQHEIDHLDGILFLDRLESPDKLIKLEPVEQVEPELVAA
jgi:peptide deformylase